MKEYVFTGNLAADPEVTVTESGKKVARFRVISSERYQDSSGQWRSTDPIGWLAEAWQKPAQAIEDAGFTKGAPVIIVGEIREHSWTTDGGEKQYRRFVSVRHMGPDVITAARLAANRREFEGSPASSEPVDGNAEWPEG